jgi:hypothetical protein
LLGCIVITDDSAISAQPLTRLVTSVSRRNRLGPFVRTMSLFNTSRLLNKTVLITGASSGIGAVSLMSESSHLISFLTSESSGDGDLVREGDQRVH